MGNKRKYHIPDQQPVSAETMLAKEKWKKVSWRRGTKGRLTCLFAARRVRVADGHRHRMLDNRVQAMPRSEEHTSELQSLMRISYAVFCLKKKTRNQKSIPITSTQIHN